MEEIGASITDELAPALRAILDITKDILTNWEDIERAIGGTIGTGRDYLLRWFIPGFAKDLKYIQQNKNPYTYKNDEIMGPPVPINEMTKLSELQEQIEALRSVLIPAMGTKTGLRSVTGKNEPTLIDMLGIDINAAPDVIMPALGEIESIYGDFEDEIIAGISRISDAFTDAIMTGKANWGDLINDLVAMFVRSGIEKILLSIFGLDEKGKESGSGGSIFGTIIGGIGKLIGLGGPTGGSAPIQIVTGDPSSFVQLGRQTITPDNAWRSSLRSRNYSREILPNG